MPTVRQSKCELRRNRRRRCSRHSPVAAAAAAIAAAAAAASSRHERHTEGYTGSEKEGYALGRRSPADGAIASGSGVSSEQVLVASSGGDDVRKAAMGAKKCPGNALTCPDNRRSFFSHSQFLKCDENRSGTPSYRDTLSLWRPASRSRFLGEVQGANETCSWRVQTHHRSQGQFPPLPPRYALKPRCCMLCRAEFTHKSCLTRKANAYRGSLSFLTRGARPCVGQWSRAHTCHGLE